MKIIILPGFSQSNKKWGIELRDYLVANSLDTSLIEWDHWSNNHEELNYEFEIKKIKSILESETIIISKSIGTIIAARMIIDELVVPVKLIMMGIPRTDKVILESFRFINPRKISIIQNIDDPYLKFESLNSFIHKFNPEINLTKTERADHNYPFNDLILDIIKK